MFAEQPIAELTNNQQRNSADAILDYASKVIKDVRLGKNPQPTPSFTLGGDVQQAIDKLSISVATLLTQKANNIEKKQQTDLFNLVQNLQDRKRDLEPG